MPYLRDSLASIIMLVCGYHSTSLAISPEVLKANLYLLVSLSPHAVREVSAVRVPNLVGPDYGSMPQIHNGDFRPTKPGI